MPGCALFSVHCFSAGVRGVHCFRGIVILVLLFVEMQGPWAWPLFPLPTPLPTGDDYNYDYNSNYDHNYYYWLVWILCCIDLKLCDSVMI